MGEAYDPTLSLPRILCLHGGGTNARIFQMQCRQIAEQLRDEYRLVFAEAPFPSDAGPDVVRVFAGSGPFKRWLRFLPSHPELSVRDAVARLDEVVEAAVAEDDERGGCGEWTALLGFSQGAKVCASLLYRQQTQAAEWGGGSGLPLFRFGVLVAGRGPLVSLEPERAANAGLPSAADLSLMKEQGPRGDHVLTIPTIHMHGLQDPGLEEHRKLYNEYCHPDARSVIEWNAGHRLPVRTDDVKPLVEAMRRLARETAATN